MDNKFTPYLRLGIPQPVTFCVLSALFTCVWSLTGADSISAADNSQTESPAEGKALPGKIVQLSCKTQNAIGLKTTTSELHSVINSVFTTGEVQADLHKVWIVAHVHKQDSAKIAIGEPIQLTIDSMPGVTFTGTINFIADSIDQATRTLTVRAEVANRDNRLKPKMFGRMSILTNSSKSICVPASAVQGAGASKVVYIPLGSDKFEERSVELGDQTDSFIEVIHGLRAGEHIVTRGSSDLRSVACKRSP